MTGRNISVSASVQGRIGWLNYADISGFYFMEGDSDYEPDSALVEFLKAGKPPIYIG
jgi:sterol 3beta-glucosyltransferase